MRGRSWEDDKGTAVKWARLRCSQDFWGRELAGQLVSKDPGHQLVQADLPSTPRKGGHRVGGCCLACSQQPTGIRSGSLWNFPPPDTGAA